MVVTSSRAHAVLYKKAFDKIIKEEYNGVIGVLVAFSGDVQFNDEDYKYNESNRSTYNWYINNCQYKDSSDVYVSIDGKDETTIHPHYIRTMTTYSLKQTPANPKQNMPWGCETMTPENLELMKRIMEMSNTNMNRFQETSSKKDYRWCTIPINIKNTGSTTLENYKLYLIFEAETTESISDKYSPYNSRLGDQAAVAQINATRESKREVFESTEYNNVIEYIPKDQCLVQTDSKTFNIGIKPKDGAEEMKIGWSLKSRDYQKEGELIVRVVPDYEDITKNIFVDTTEDLKEPLIEITPKII